MVCSGYQQQVVKECVSSSGSIDREYSDHEKNDYAHSCSEPEFLDDKHDNFCNIFNENDLITNKLGRKYYKRNYDRTNFISFKGNVISNVLWINTSK